MKIVQSGEKYWAIMGIYPTQSLFNVNFFVATFIRSIDFGGNLVFLFYEANTFVEYSNCIFTCSVTTMATICFIILASKKSLMFDLIDLFEKLAEKRTKTPTMRAMYEKTNRVAEKWSKLAFLAIVHCMPIALVFPKAIFVYLIYFATDAGSVAFDLPFLTWYPFDWRTPIGYFFAVIMQYIETLYTLMFAAVALSIGLGGFLIAYAVLKDIRAIINSINDNAHLDGNRIQMIEQLSDFIETHSLILEIFDAFMRIIKIMSMVFFAWQCIAACVSLVILQMEISKLEIDYLALLQTITIVFSVSIAEATACELGERLCGMFSSVDETMDEIDWYLYPIEIKRMLPTIMIVTQKPIYVEMFGSITASRETFKRVMKGGWSVFMVLREFM